MEQLPIERIRPRLISIKKSPLSEDEGGSRLISTQGRVAGTRMIIPTSSGNGPILEAEVLDGLDRCQFSVIYQPQHQLGSAQSIYGYEALGRWSRAGRGVLLPKDFLPTAERARDRSLIAKVNIQIVQLALKQYCSNRRMGKLAKKTELSLNVSCKALSDFFVKSVTDTISSLELDYSRICIEVRAEELTHDSHCCNSLLAFREAGCNVLIDGYSLRSPGLSFLVDGTANRIKLARSFVAGVATNHREMVALDHLMSLTGALGVEVLANGIELQQQLERVQIAGLEYGQGWLLSRPVDLLAA